MKLIKPSFEIIEPTGYTIDDIYKSIELAGRVSHKSEHNIKEGSAKDFVGRMLNMKHLATCEFGTVYLQYSWPGIICQHYDQTALHKLLDKYTNNKYSIVRYHGNDIYVTTNLRVLIENNWLDDLKYLCEPTEYHEKRYTVKFICDRGISHEFVRHRKFSFIQESTRYCNYSKDKFDNEITYILPPWISEFDVHNFYKNPKGDNFIRYNENSLGGSFIFLFNLEELEEAYIALIKEEGWKPEQARAILPNSLKTELYMCGFVEDWRHFFELRCATNAHPQAKELAIPLQEEFIKQKLILKI